MLSQLSIRNIVLIENLDIQFTRGLSVLTGETGAGKSILLDSLILALGGRGDGKLVRNGAEEGSVVAVFELADDHPVRQYLSDNAIAASEVLIFRRVQNADGRTRAFINDAPVSVGLMREIGEMLVEIHGQHEERAMLDPDSHRRLLDCHGGIEVDCELVETAWKAWKSSEKSRDALLEEVENARKEADYLRASCDELTLLAPEPGEEGVLAERRQQMMRIEEVASDLAEAQETLCGNATPVGVISNLARRLELKRARVPELVDETLSHLDSALNALYSAQSCLEAACNKTHFDPDELESTEERLFALRAASRKFSVAVENLPDLAVRMADELAMLEDGADRLAALEDECKVCKSEYFRLAGNLSSRRKQASENLVKAVMAELPALKLEQAEFMVELTCDTARAGPSGIDNLEFWVKTNPGTRAGAMRKVASGGELARFMLALKVALAERGSAPTLVFDEIDSGVGGAVADAIGQRLVRLAGKVQVLSVTHAPQVAARARGHYLISKAAVSNSKRVATEVEQISETSRLEEIARMLSGANVTNEARAQAEKLINQPAI